MPRGMATRRAAWSRTNKLLAAVAVAGSMLCGTGPAAGQAADPRLRVDVRTERTAPTVLGRAAGPRGVVTREIVALVKKHFGVDASRVPVHIVDRRGLAAAYRRISGRPMKGRVRGFEHGGTVYIDGDHLDFPETLTHELLHALSTRFSSQAGARGHHALVEGITQHLTMTTGIDQRLADRGLKRRGSAYGIYVRFAERLSELVGRDRLIDCYFERGYHALIRTVDGIAGPGAMTRAAGHLAQGDYAAALDALGMAGEHPFDGVFR